MHEPPGKTEVHNWIEIETASGSNSGVSLNLPWEKRDWDTDKEELRDIRRKFRECAEEEERERLLKWEEREKHCEEKQAMLTAISVVSRSLFFFLLLYSLLGEAYPLITMGRVDLIFEGFFLLLVVSWNFKINTIFYFFQLLKKKKFKVFILSLCLNS